METFFVCLLITMIIMYFRNRKIKNKSKYTLEEEVFFKCPQPYKATKEQFQEFLDNLPKYQIEIYRKTCEIYNVQLTLFQKDMIDNALKR